MNKEIKIVPPEGYSIDKENSTFECIKFKPIKKGLPKTWEEYCKNTKRKVGEAWINEDSDIVTIGFGLSKYTKTLDQDRNLLPSKELAEAMLALCQLIQLRDCYNDGWTPDWTSAETKYTIVQHKNVPTIECTWSTSRILTFKTEELRDQFLKNFNGLIEIAKPLL